MAKAKKVEYGIEITKPWSKEMYAHNDEVMKVAKEEIKKEWLAAYDLAQDAWEDHENEHFPFAAWNEAANNSMQYVQSAITYYSFGSGFTVEDVETEVLRELELAPYYRVKEMVEELDIRLTKGFVGFN